MKRFFALALVLVMALSMMAMTASAAPITCPTHGTVYEPCTEHRTASHYYIRNITPDNIVEYCVFYRTKFDGHDEAPISVFTANGVTPTKGMLVYDGDGFGVCKYPPAPAQPKTGVMDTLPVWFGVMAVSACAYVLTSKKKVF